ncbi:MAG: hypothetical protein H7X86_04095 [Gorillibacterium sp.]|nr:hypothetical protein [Gorillibacterium sp.]
MSKPIHQTSINLQEGRTRSMNELSYDSSLELARTKKDTKVKRAPRWVTLSIIILIWLAIGYGGYALARNYIGNIQHQLDRVARTNEMQMLELNTKLTTLQTALDEQKKQAEMLQKHFAAVESELTAVKEEMSLAGDSLSTTAKTKKALNERVNDLSKELGELRKLIKRLEEAARVY